jgi:hypothetical protein
MWKTTDRYVQQKRVKAVESEHKLKQVYVPDYAKLGELTVGSDRAWSGRNVQVGSWYCTEISSRVPFSPLFFLADICQFIFVMFLFFLIF